MSWQSYLLASVLSFITPPSLSLSPRNLANGRFALSRNRGELHALHGADEVKLTSYSFLFLLFINVLFLQHRSPTTLRLHEIFAELEVGVIM